MADRRPSDPALSDVFGEVERNFRQTPTPLCAGQTAQMYFRHPQVRIATQNTEVLGRWIHCSADRVATSVYAWRQLSMNSPK